MAEKEKEVKGSLFEALTYLVLYDDAKRWIGLSILIACGAILAASSDPKIAMGVGLPLAALLLFGFYYFIYFHGLRENNESAVRTNQLVAAPLLRHKLMVTTIALMSLVFGFGTGLQHHETRILNQRFASAYRASDFSSMASVTQQAQEVNQKLYTTLVAESEPRFIAATEQPATWNGMLQYLGTVTAPIPEQMRLIVKKSAHIEIASGYKFTNGSFDISEVGGDAFIPVQNPYNKVELPALIDTVIKGGQQSLDGFEWTNVTFIGTRISYKGGIVNLNNVRFVNCTFDLPPDRRGAKLAQYVALALPTLNFEGAAS